MKRVRSERLSDNVEELRKRFIECDVSFIAAKKQMERVNSKLHSEEAKEEEQLLESLITLYECE